MLESLEQTLVYALPDACLLPVAQALPARHAATAKLLRQIFPRSPSAQNENNACQRNAIGRPRATSSRFAMRLGEQRFDLRPQSIINESSGHFPRAKQELCQPPRQLSGKVG